jgi:hypothetical protein
MATYPPDWAVFLVSEETLEDILEHVGLDEEDLLENLNSHIESDHVEEIGCAAFYEGLDSIHRLYPYNNDENQKYISNYLAVSASAGIIGFLAVEQIFDDDEDKYHVNIFEHQNGDSEGHHLEAFVGKITWTCSFTNSPVEFRGRPVRDIIGEQKAAPHIINVGKYITDRVCAMLLDELHEFDEETEDVDRVLLFSTGIETARRRHRKNGKLSACRFLEEWENFEGSNIMEAYDQELMNNLMFYFWSADGAKFVGGDLYHWLSATGSDLSTITNEAAADKYGNTNYSCPSGIKFNNFGVVEEGKAYEYSPGGKRARGGSRRTRGRRRAFGRPSRRRGSN